MASACFSAIKGSLATTTTTSSRPEGRLWRSSLLHSPRLMQSFCPSDLRPLSLTVSRKKLNRNYFSAVVAARAELSMEEVQALDSPVDDESDGPDDGYGPPINNSEDSKLYVGNLPWSCNSEELADVFQKVGSVEMVEVIYDRESGRSRGFGFVTMSSVEDANAAIQKFDGAEYAGRTLRVNFPNRNRGDMSGPPPPRARFDGNNANKLFVGNLAWGVDDAVLEKFFSEHGKVLEARVVTDRDTGRSRGFGFVTMSSEAEANEALNKMDGAPVEGRNLRVNLAGDKPPPRGDFF